MPESNQTSAVIATRPANRTLRTVIIIFGLLFLAVASELGYYFYTTYKTNLAKKGLEETAAPAADGTVLQVEKALTFAQGLNTNRGDFYKEATIRSVLEGKVVEIEKKDAIVGSVKYEYSVFLTNKTGITTKWYISQGEIDGAKIFLLSPSGNKQPIGFGDIKPGDYITASETIDLLDPKPEYDVTLTVTRGQ